MLCVVSYHLLKIFWDCQVWTLLRWEWSLFSFNSNTQGFVYLRFIWKRLELASKFVIAKKKTHTWLYSCTLTKNNFGSFWFYSTFWLDFTQHYLSKKLICSSTCRQFESLLALIRKLQILSRDLHILVYSWPLTTNSCNVMFFSQNYYTIS